MCLLSRDTSTDHDSKQCYVRTTYMVSADVKVEVYMTTYVLERSKYCSTIFVALGHSIAA